MAQKEYDSVETCLVVMWRADEDDRAVLRNVERPAGSDLAEEYRDDSAPERELSLVDWMRG